MIKIKPDPKRPAVTGKSTVTRDTTRDTENNAATKRTHAARQRAYRKRKAAA